MGKLLSMTGYGSAKGSVEGQEITVELKSVNNRYLDCSVRLPRNFLFAEDTVFNAMREREGERLRRDMLGKLETIEGLVSVVEERSPQTVKEYRERLEARLRDILADRSLDEQRVITEAAIFADRTAVDEETVRLRSHIAQFRTMLEEGSPIGRKMDFLVQEFNRESNTIGSKCSDASLAKVVVDLKSEIEKIREQLQNVE